jgi:hypothetical protein
VIRAQTAEEIARGLHHAADVCLECGRICWSALDVCISDGTFDAAHRLLTPGDDANYASTPMHAALFLDLAAAAQGNL